MSGELPGVKVEPVVRHLNLISVDDFLLENSISISKTVTPGRVVERGKTVQEASGESAKATVAQRSVVLLGDDVLNSEAKLGEASYKRMSAGGHDVEHILSYPWQCPSVQRSA